MYAQAANHAVVAAAAGDIRTKAAAYCKEMLFSSMTIIKFCFRSNIVKVYCTPPK